MAKIFCSEESLHANGERMNGVKESGRARKSANSLNHIGLRICALLLKSLLNLIGQCTDFFNFTGYGVATFEKIRRFKAHPHTGWRACGNDGTCF